MAYLGNAPARSFISFERQVFTIVNSQTAYTLDHSVNNENDIRLVINNIVQEPGSGKAYTASGTTLTLSAALTNGTDEMYCVFLGRAVATNAPSAGSVGTSQLASDAVTEAKIADDAVESEHLNVNVITGQTAETSIATDDTILIHDTSASALRKMTRANFVSGIGGTNTPAFAAKISATQNVATATETKIQMATEVFDTDGDYDHSTNYRFTPTTAGKYCFVAGLRYSTFVAGRAVIWIRKNGSSDHGINEQYGDNSQSSQSCMTTVILDMNGSSDYVEAYTYQNTGSSRPLQEPGTATFFQGFKLIGV
jgi:hypothetical protein